MTTTTCDHCDTCAPADAVSIHPRVGNQNNPPANHTHAVRINRDGRDWFLYDGNGCDYCDSAWATLNFINGDLSIHQFSVKTSVLNAYDRARYDAVFHKPRGSDAVRAMFTQYMSSYGVWGSITVNVCLDCLDAGAHTVDRDTPVFGVNCVDNDTRAEMVARATAYGEADRVKDEEARNWRHPKTY